jgi:Rrf2 family transcriptional regulator, cysteine metabolism repressor
MVDLASRNDKGSVSMKDIAKSQDISEKYLSQILITLKSAGLVEGFRGIHGGYVLSRSAENITVKEIVSALEGDLSVIDCLQHQEICSRESMCLTQEVWHKVSEAVTGVLDSITLSDLAARCKQNQQSELMYYI